MLNTDTMPAPGRQWQALKAIGMVLMIKPNVLESIQSKCLYVLQGKRVKESKLMKGQHDNKALKTVNDDNKTNIPNTFLLHKTLQHKKYTYRKP